MNTITIIVTGEELENLSIELTSEEVSALYKLRKEQTAKLTELEKKLSDKEQTLKWASEARTIAENELSQAHTLLTALGVSERTNEEEGYNRKMLTATTRIALYISQIKGKNND